MHSLSGEAATVYLEERERCGDHIDKNLRLAISQAQAILRFTILDQDTLLSLRWHARDDTRILTPKGDDRSLYEVVNRMKENDLTFDKLASRDPQINEVYSRKWFEKCQQIDTEFDCDLFGFLLLCEANHNEVTETPNGLFYIKDGNHKALVLAKKLLLDDFDRADLDGRRCSVVVRKRSRRRRRLFSGVSRVEFSD